VEKGKRIHIIVAVVSMIVEQTIVGWKDLMAMGVISPDWPAMPRQETEGRILAADEDKEEKELGSRNLYRRTKSPLRTRPGRSSTKGAIAPGSELGIQRSDREGLAHGMVPPYPR
jgi:hypothetical protein